MNTLTPATPSDCARRYGLWAMLTGDGERIGHALAIESARRRLHLAPAARREPVVQPLAGDLRRDHGIDVRGVAVDMAEALRLPQASTRVLDIGLPVSQPDAAAPGTGARCRARPTGGLKPPPCPQMSLTGVQAWNQAH